jgi:hypothetical protein
MFLQVRKGKAKILKPGEIKINYQLLLFRLPTSANIWDHLPQFAARRKGNSNCNLKHIPT